MKKIIQKLHELNISQIVPHNKKITKEERSALNVFHTTISSLNPTRIKESIPDINWQLLTRQDNEDDRSYLSRIFIQVVPLINFYNHICELHYQLQLYCKLLEKSPYLREELNSPPTYEYINSNIIQPILQDINVSTWLRYSTQVLFNLLQLITKNTIAKINSCYQETTQLTATQIKESECADTADYIKQLTIRRTALYEKANHLVKLRSDINKNIAAQSLINQAHQQLLQKIISQFLPQQENFELTIFNTCVSLLEKDEEFPRVLQKTEHYLTSLKQAICSPYYQHNNFGDMESTRDYRQRLNGYKTELAKYRQMVEEGIEYPSRTAHSAFNRATSAKNLYDSVASQVEYENSDYVSISERFTKFSEQSNEYLSKIEQIEKDIDAILFPNQTTLSKALEEQQHTHPVKKIVVTVATSEENPNCHISGHQTGGHMMAILFDGDNTPLCISQFPVFDEEQKQLRNYKGDLTKKERGGLLGFVLKLFGLPHHIYPMVNVDFEQEKIEHKEQNVTIFPPIVFYCDDEIGIDFDQALAQAKIEQPAKLYFDIDNNCADPIRKIFEAGLTGKKFSLASSTLAGITLPITLYKNLQKLHDKIQLKRNLRAKKQLTVEQQQLEINTRTTKVEELKLNLVLARDALTTIASAISQIANYTQQNHSDISILIPRYVRQLNEMLILIDDSTDWTYIDSGKIFIEIRRMISSEYLRCLDQLIDINHKNKYPIQPAEFEQKLLNKLIVLFKQKSIVLPLYFDVILDTLTDLLNTLPLPSDYHLAQIRLEISDKLPTILPVNEFNLDIPIYTHEKVMKALTPTTRNDSQANLFLNAINLRNIILDIQNKIAKLTAQKIRLQKQINSARASDDAQQKQMLQIDSAIAYCNTCNSTLQNAFGKMNQYNYFDSFDIVARMGQANPFVALKKIFPSINPYNHLQDIFKETANIFPSNTISKPWFWQFWKKYDYKKAWTNQFIKEAFANTLDPMTNYLAIKKQIEQLRPSGWSTFWLSERTVARRNKYCNELEEKAHLLCLLQAFTQGGLNVSELILSLTAMVNNPASVYKNNINELIQNLSDTHAFHKKQTEDNEIYVRERTALKSLTSTAAILLRCQYPNRNDIPSEGNNISIITDILSLDDQLSQVSSTTSQHSPIMREDPEPAIRLPDNLEEKLFTLRQW